MTDQCRCVRPKANGWLCCQAEAMHLPPHRDVHNETHGPWVDRDQTACLCGHLEREHDGPCGSCTADSCGCDGMTLSHILEIAAGMLP